MLVSPVCRYNHDGTRPFVRRVRTKFHEPNFASAGSSEFRWWLRCHPTVRKSAFVRLLRTRPRFQAPPPSQSLLLQPKQHSPPKHQQVANRNKPQFALLAVPILSSVVGRE